MPWTVRIPAQRIAFAPGCVLCRAPEVVGAVARRHRHYTGFYVVATTYRDIHYNLPVCARCARRARALLWGGIGLAVLPWVAAVALVAALDLGEHAISAALWTVFGLSLFGALLLTLRALWLFGVRLVDASGDTWTWGFRNKALAHETAEVWGDRAKFELVVFRLGWG